MIGRWSRKGRCPSCNVGGGSNHSKTCTLQIKLKSDKTMKIEYYKKNVYGNDYYYIKDVKIASAVQMLTGKKTISEMDKESLEYLGCTFVQVIV